MGSMAIAADAGSMVGGGGGTQSPVLRVIVENLFYPVTLDVLHQVGGATGVFLCPKIKIFPSYLSLKFAKGTQQPCNCSFRTTL